MRKWKLKRWKKPKIKQELKMIFMALLIGTPSFVSVFYLIRFLNWNYGNWIKIGFVFPMIILSIYFVLLLIVFGWAVFYSLFEEIEVEGE